jgi:Na+/proline symporter
MKATLWFNIAHYALRPWPWVIVALASLIIYPNLDAITARFPGLDPSIVRNDLGYPAMLVFLPHGLLGLVVASLAAAYMSTISTHLNWGASYIVDDFYRRFVASDKDEHHYVRVARISTVLLIILAGMVSLWLENALQAFQILLQIGAGTGLIFLLRWYWWRISAYSELSGMIISFAVAVYFELIHVALGFPALHPSLKLVLGVTITTAVWLTVTFMTPPTDQETLQAFYNRIRPFNRGWSSAVETKPGAGGSFSAAMLCWFLGVLIVYAALFGTGFLLYGQALAGLLGLSVAVIAAFGLFRALPRVGFE